MPCPFLIASTISIIIVSRFVLVWSQLVRIASDDQLEQANCICVIENQSVICVLEGSLHLLNVVGTAADVNLRVLRVLNTQAVSASLIVGVPPSMTLLEVVATLANAQAYVLVIKLSPIELQKVNEVLAKVNVVRATPLVLPLQIAGHHHGEKERRDTAMVSLIQLSGLQEAFEHEQHRTQFRILFEQLLDKLDTVDPILSVKANVDIY